MTTRQNSSDSEEIRQSLDVLDRILSEFDDIETDTNEEGGVPPPCPTSEDTPDPPEPPPVDRSLKPRDPPAPAPPDLPRKTRVPRPGSGSSSPSSHEYQEINSDVCGGQSPPEAPEPITSPTGRRQMSEERARRHDDEGRRHDEGRRQPRRQRSEEGRGRRNEMSSSSGDLGPPRARAPRDHSRGRGREGREQRHLRKSRSGDVEARRPQDPGRRRSRSSDRLLDHPAPPHHMYHPPLYDPSMVGTSMMDPAMVDLRLMDPRLLDPRYIDEPYPLPQDPGPFPHLMRYPTVPQPGPLSPGSLSPGALSPIPPGAPVGPPFLPIDYPPYPMYPYDQGYLVDPTLGPDPSLLGPLPPHLPPPPYPPDYPLYYGPPLPPPSMIPGMWGGSPRPHPDWPPPSPEQARRAIHSLVRPPGRGGSLEEERGDNPKMHLHAGRPGSRRLTSIGHSDSSGRSSPTEEQRHGGRRWGGEAGSEFRVGEAVRCTGNMKNSTSLPHFSSGKDSGFEEAPVVGEDGHNTGGGRGGRAGGAFIVSGVFNDSSRMFIPAPPSPTPDYDDGDESDGNDSDILQGSQFCPANESRGEKKRVGNRDSLSDDSLHNAPIGAGRSSKASTPIKNPPTPLQNMMKEFHQGLPPVDHENGFSDDSLEDSTAAPSRPSTMSQKPHCQTSVESLASMESSTASFDYMNAGQARSSAYEKSRSRPSPTTPVSGNNSMQKGNNYRDRKDVNGKVKKSSSRSSENIVSPRESVKAENGSAKGDSGNFNRQSSRDSSQSSGSNSSKPSEKFDTIRHMLKEGLIEGLDESPPQFKPPPVSKEMLNGTQAEDRADSGLGSIFSTTRTDESGASDLSNTPPSLTSPQDSSKTKNRREKETVRSRASIASEDIERNRDEGDEVEVQMQETLEIPPPPPPRDESMHWTPKLPGQRDPTRHPARSVPSTPASSKNPSWLHNPVSGRDEALDLASSQFSQSVDKITHVDDLYGQQEQAESGSEVSSAINGSLASHYSTHDNDNPLTDREFLENLKNLEPRPRPDTLAVITEDQGSLGSRGSRSGRLLSRIADSVRSGSRTPTPSSSAATTRATTTKLTSTSRSSTRIHGDIIREPWRSSVRESALPSPQEYSRLPSLSPSVVPLTRDGSGRFRSIEDIAEAASSPAPHGKKKKHSTLPPNLTPADIKKENKELRRATSLMVGKKGKDGSEGSKFRFNFFRGFWRRKQYSFDNKV